LSWSDYFFFEGLHKKYCLQNFTASAKDMENRITDVYVTFRNIPQHVLITIIERFMR